MEQRARDAIKIGDKLFDNKRDIDSLWQEIALNFYPERADFTSERSYGEEFADHLFTSYPSMARRELGNMMASSLRPRSEKWFSIHVDNEDIDEGDEERAFLEHLTEIQWRAMYDRTAGLVRATKEADHDFVAFGNAVIKFGPNANGDGLLYRDYHLRDCAWSENAEGTIDALHRKWKPTARQIMQFFPKTASQEVRRAMKMNPETEFECRHIVLPSRIYDYKGAGGKEFPFVSLFVERASETILEEVGLNYFCYVVPRWQTVSGSPFGVSMATMVLIPDGRTLQVMIRTIREAGEKWVDPPMIAFSDAIRGDIALYAGGVTTADVEYDERAGEVLRPVTQQKEGMPIGLDLAASLRQDIRSGFFLDKIQLPETSTDMTAFEVRRRLEEHIRGASPIFEPIEQEYNDPLCDGTFKVLSQYGGFPMEMMPESLQGADIRFSFRSPLAEMADQKEAEALLDIRDRLIIPMADIDSAQFQQINWDEAVRDCARALGAKQKWFNPLEAIQDARDANNEAAEKDAQLDQAAGIAQVAADGGKGIADISKAIAGGK